MVDTNKSQFRLVIAVGIGGQSLTGGPVLMTKVEIPQRSTCEIREWLDGEISRLHPNLHPGLYLVVLEGAWFTPVSRFIHQEEFGIEIVGIQKADGPTCVVYGLCVDDGDDTSI